MKLKKMLQRKLSIGRFGLPLWALGLAGGMMAAVAGQAVGPVLAGSVTGSVGATVSQTVVLSDAQVHVTGTPIAGDPFSDYGASNGLAVINDEGTSFTAAIETQVGRSQVIALTPANGSGANANAVLEMNVPAGLDIAVREESGTTLQEARLSQNQWLMKVDNGNAEKLFIEVEPKDDLAPGFYTITGRIVQIAG